MTTHYINKFSDLLDKLIDPTVAIGVVFLLIATVIVLIAVVRSNKQVPDAAFLSSLICITAALFGYGVGIVCFPLEGEEDALGPLAKGGAAIISGFLLAKSSEILTPIFKGEKDALYVTRFLIFLSSFLIVLIFTFMARTNYFIT